jgi:FMN-dependent NADH-azoreductase
VNILRIDASIQGTSSAGSALADLVVTEATQGRPDATVVRRHLAAEPLPSTAWADAVSAGYVAAEQRTPAQVEALALAGSLADELRAADAAVLALPLYNYGVSQHVKIWMDLAIAGAPMGERLLDGTPVVLVVTRGGGYGPGTPREGWDHNVDYVRRIVGDVWGAELTVVERELTLVGVNPALDELAELGALARKTAEEAAIEAGAALGEHRAA